MSRGWRTWARGGWVGVCRQGALQTGQERGDSSSGEVAGSLAAGELERSFSQIHLRTSRGLDLLCQGKWINAQEQLGTVSEQGAQP